MNGSYTVKPASNKWDIYPSVSDHYTYGGSPTLTGKARLGNITWKIYTDANGDQEINKSFSELSAGNYWTRASVVIDNYYDMNSVYLPFTVDKADSTLVINDDVSKTYDGMPINTPSDFTINGTTKTPNPGTWSVVKGNNGEDLPVNDPTPINAGTYKYKVTVDGDDNHESATAEKEFEIKPAKNTISFVKDNLDTVYTGEAVETPAVEQVANGAVTYTWEQLDKNNKWHIIDNAPVHAGHYRVTATSFGNNNYESQTVTLPFEIAQASNSWTKELSLSKWSYKGTVEDPAAAAKIGDVEFYYSRVADDFSNAGTAKPTASGKWYIKVVVKETADYEGLESDPIEFYIDTINAAKYYTLTAKAGENGKISPDGVAVAGEKTNWTYTITPNEGYEIADVLVDSKSVGAVSTYTFEEIDGDHTIEASFKEAGKKDPQKDVTVDTDGNIILPGADLNDTADDIKISTGKDGSRPTYKEDEKVVITADGSVISRPGLADITAGANWKVALDGTVTDTEGNVYKTDGKVYGTDGSIKNADGSYAQPAKPMIESAEASL